MTEAAATAAQSAIEKPTASVQSAALDRKWVNCWSKMLFKDMVLTRTRSRTRTRTRSRTQTLTRTRTLTRTLTRIRTLALTKDMVGWPLWERLGSWFARPEPTP